ncbi:helix-hairpin-helix domain-containing protein [Arthrobacter sp. StoSoilA2]|uniref:helix-hairpin-helix domain-containing protein n=1 Tax=Arthrobacter sp. StoSoilA2 TaxID=2830990 RepID=UPI001CC7B797|nr:helix-hairpin-helix domain-containing protein [Arthrobacter sp. StoSoilA2]
MPRWNRDGSPDAAALAARRRLAAGLNPPDDPAPLLAMPPLEEPAPEASASDPLQGQETMAARFRWRTSWRVAVAVSVVGAACAAWFLLQAATGQPTTEPLSQSVPVEGSVTEGDGLNSTGPTPPSQNTKMLLVHVAGAVQKPGVVSLAEGSRVFQAIDAAGGATATADLNGLNLAEVVTDGAKIHVPAVGEASQQETSQETGSGNGAGGPAETQVSPGSGGAKVNINTASVEELGTLPRVGPVMAQRIVDWRKEHGAFASVEELDAIDGIGPKLMESLQDLVTVQGG